jgi:GNAT superfamily N-acetyltransferase
MDVMSIEIEQGWKPGLIGDIVSAHGVYYAREWGFGQIFEAKVARELACFLDACRPETDRLFHATHHGRFAGSLAIDGSDAALPAGMAHLRWFIVADQARGGGVGRLLMTTALRFLAEAGFRSCYLSTFAGLNCARRLYEAAGFVLEHEQDAETWGTRVTEQRFVLHIG